MATDVTISDYVELPMTVDEATLADNAIEALRAAWPGWEPNDGDPEVVQIEAVAPMAAAAVAVAANMPSAALRAFGTKLLNIAYQQGTPAGTTVTFDCINGGVTIPAGSQLEIDGFAFAVYQDTVVPPSGSSVSGVQVYASGTPTAAANGLTGALVAQLSLPAFVTGATVEQPTAGGTDPQSDSDYQSMISSEQRLRAKTIVTTRDFEIEALAFSEEIGRAMAIGDTARNVTVTIATVTGQIVSAPTKTALEAHYETFEQVNTTYTIGDPTYTTINVVWEAKMLPLPSTDPTDLQARVNAVLTLMLSPAVYGQPNAGDPGSISGWVNDNTIRLNELIAWIAGVRGIAYVKTVTLNGSAADLVMAGVAPLPLVGTISGTIDP